LTPASGRYLLDTNIIIALLAGEDTVLSNLDQAAEVFVPAVALGELFYGAAKSGRPAENTAKLERFASGRAIILCDLDVAREYGSVKQQLREKGRPIPENDIWIAAAAKHYGLTLVTRDGHFAEVEGLQTAARGHTGAADSANSPHSYQTQSTCRTAISGLTPDRPFKMLDSVFRLTPSPRAASVTVRFSGSKQSSFSTSPGCGGLCSVMRVSPAAIPHKPAS
jgi:tRNA(fMet)-specific endonuclease VapC